VTLPALAFERVSRGREAGAAHPLKQALRECSSEARAETPDDCARASPHTVRNSLTVSSHSSHRAHDSAVFSLAPPSSAATGFGAPVQCGQCQCSCLTRPQVKQRETTGWKRRCFPVDRMPLREGVTLRFGTAISSSSSAGASGGSHAPPVGWSRRKAGCCGSGAKSSPLSGAGAHTAAPCATVLAARAPCAAASPNEENSGLRNGGVSSPKTAGSRAVYASSACAGARCLHAAVMRGRPATHPAGAAETANEASLHAWRCIAVR